MGGHQEVLEAFAAYARIMMMKLRKFGQDVARFNAVSAAIANATKQPPCRLFFLPVQQG